MAVLDWRPRSRAFRLGGSLVVYTRLIGAVSLMAPAVVAPSLALAQAQQQQDQGSASSTAASSAQGSGEATSRSAPPATPSYNSYQGVDIGGASSTGDDTEAAMDRTGDRTGLNRSQRQTYQPILSERKAPAEPSEFEKYVESAVGRKVPRFGSNLMTSPVRDFALPAQATIPPDYPLNIGDTVSVALSGSVSGSADFTIDTDGRINIPKVGSVSLVGVRYRDLKDRIAAAIGRQYRGYEVSVSIRKLRGVRVYVTGFANNPGAFSVNSLSTLLNAVMAAGGPSAGGSYRSIQLIRNGRKVADFDLYDVLRRGDRSKDPILQNEDVIFIEPVGQQVAVVGSVNEEGIYEARPGEMLADVIRYAGGISALGDKSRAIVYSIRNKETSGSQEVLADNAGSAEVAGGDLIQVLSKGSLVQPLDRQQVLVKIDGEVRKPGNYYVAPGTPLSAVMEMAGGFTDRAYVYGTKLTRLSIKQQQQEAFRQAIDQFEVEVDAAPLSPGQFAGADQAAQREAARQVISRLRQSQPDGRLVLPVDYGATALPGDLVLENNDRLYVPPRLPTVGVFGSVYRPASFLFSEGDRQRVKDMVERAGGPQSAADKSHIFVVRASGEVITRKRGAMNAYVRPGDVVFVPVRTRSSSFLTKLTAISQAVFSLGLTAATVNALSK